MTQIKNDLQNSHVPQSRKVIDQESPVAGSSFFFTSWPPWCESFLVQQTLLPCHFYIWTCWPWIDLLKLWAQNKFPSLKFCVSCLRDKKVTEIVSKPLEAYMGTLWPSVCHLTYHSPRTLPRGGRQVTSPPSQINHQDWGQSNLPKCQRECTRVRLLCLLKFVDPLWLAH